MNLKLLNANMWLLPPPTSLENNKRLERFIRLATKISPDVINLQEVWLNEYVGKLKKAFKGYYTVKQRSFIYNRSGLVTFLKYKPKSWKFRPFRMTWEHNVVERIAQKGFLEIKIEISGKEVVLLNTHVYATRDKKKKTIKLNQAEEVLGFAKQHNPTIVAGDLNLKPSDLKPFIKHLIGVKKYSPTYSETNRYAHMGFNRIENRNGIHIKRQDYVFANAKSGAIKIKEEVITKPALSDHYPILAEVSL